MGKLVIKLPFARTQGCLCKQNINNERKNSSTARSRKYRQRLKSDPNLQQKHEELKHKKKQENERYRAKIKDLRQENELYNEYITYQERLRKQKHRTGKTSKVRQENCKEITEIS